MPGVAQYYNLIRLGRAGYQAIHQACQDVAKHLAEQIGALGPFELVSRAGDLPVFAWKLREPQQLVSVRSGGPLA